MAEITLAQLTEAKTNGLGVFDVLMRSNKEHLEQEFKLSRIKGPEYATVYLGSLESVMKTALEFLLQKEKLSLETQLLEQQILLAQVQVQKAQAELEIIQASLPKITAEIAHIEAETALTGQKTLNAVTENTVLIAQECKLRAEYDVLMLTKDKTTQEAALLTWKVTTEKAQTLAIGVDDNSVVGKQKLLYAAQTDGFKRDAEQKAAKVMVDTWNVRRTTDEATQANVTNKLDDATVGRVVDKLLAGVNA